MWESFGFEFINFLYKIQYIKWIIFKSLFL